MYIYRKTEQNLWTVGFYSPDGKWEAERDYVSSEEAAKRVHFLNGGEDEEAKQRRKTAEEARRGRGF